MALNYMENIQGISRELHQGGFRVEEIIDDRKLPEKLMPFCLKYARGIYYAIRIVPNELTEFEWEDFNGPGIWRPNFPGHVLYARPNVNHKKLQNTLEIHIVFDAIKVRGGDKNKKIFTHLSHSVHTLKREFPEVYGESKKD